MIATPWDRIDSATLRALCDEGAAESPTLDFKQIAPAMQRDDPRNEFAKDVCAFANASGGDIVYGIATTGDVAHTVLPMSAEPFDACKRRLSETLANHVEPRIAGIRYKEVPIDDQGYALIIRVPQSFDGPHRYQIRSQAGSPAHYRFVMRSSTGTIDMDYTQLRDSFGRTASLVEQARLFRHNRLSRMEREDFPRPMPVGAKLVVHFVPLSGVARGAMVDIPALYHRSEINFARPGGHIPQKETNLDGILMAASINKELGTFDWYIQVFRNGAMEIVSSALNRVSSQDDGPSFIPAVSVSSEARRVCQQVLTHARALDMEGPAVLGIACLEAARYQFKIHRNGSDYGNSRADRNHLVIAEQWIDEVSADISVDTLIRPLLDSLWQCFGEVRCDLYSPTGEWDTRR